VLAAISAAGLVALAAPAHAQWTLIFADEFNATSLDTSVWEPMIGTGTAYGTPAGWGNNELQYYTNRASNVSVSNGLLRITALRENFGGRNYTSARLRTLNNLDFKWGRVEARMRLPSTSGIWPAFWMLATNSPYGGWAASGEIDIMESVNNADRIYGTIHHGGPFPANTFTGGSIADGRDFSANFYTYSVEWEPDTIRWFIDGVQYYEVTSATWFSTAAPANNRAPFDNPFHLLLNIAVGGNFPGNPDASATFPQVMEVDSVRVFRREQAPFSATPVRLPGLVEAEHYDTGYPGEAFSDTTAGNTGAAFRLDDVDVQASTEGGFNIGWVSSGEWLEYTVDAGRGGLFGLEARVASLSTGGTFRIELVTPTGNQDLTGTILAPPTGGWQTWTTVKDTLRLPAGISTLRLQVLNTTGGFNINWLRFTQPVDIGDSRVRPALPPQPSTRP
jgi:beta-glucanase (GH16 family)